MNPIKKWLATKTAAAYRNRRFARAAAIRAWYRGAAVLLALCSLLFFMQTTPIRLGSQVVAALVAVGYLWMDVHYGAKSLQRRFERREQQREMRKLQRELQLLST